MVRDYGSNADFVWHENCGILCPLSGTLITQFNSNLLFALFLEVIGFAAVLVKFRLYKNPDMIADGLSWWHMIIFWKTTCCIAITSCMHPVWASSARFWWDHGSTILAFSWLRHGKSDGFGVWTKYFRLHCCLSICAQHYWDNIFRSHLTHRDPLTHVFVSECIRPPMVQI